MEDSNINNKPPGYNALLAKCKKIGFSMPSDLYIGSLLKTLVCSKPKSNFLELGTGIGLSLAWMIDGMDNESKLITIDNNQELIKVARQYFDNDPRVNILCEDGSQWIKNYSGGKFDLIFADAWPGKYSELDETLELLNSGGLYVIDDMSTQPNWPDGHEEKAKNLIYYLENRDDLNITKMNWSTGVIIASKRR